MAFAKLLIVIAVAVVVADDDLQDFEFSPHDGEIMIAQESRHYQTIVKPPVRIVKPSGVTNSHRPQYNLDSFEDLEGNAEMTTKRSLKNYKSSHKLRAKEGMIRDAVLRALERKDHVGKFAQILPIIRAMSGNQRVALASLVASQVSTPPGRQPLNLSQFAFYWLKMSAVVYVLAAVTEGYRLERPPHCKPQLYRAMHSCWHADPSQRPTFAALKAQLAELLDNEPSEGNYVDLDSFYQESSVYSDPSAIIHDDEGLSAEYDRERRCFRELTKGPAKYDNRGFNFRDEDLRNKFGIGTPRMGGFGIRDVPFNDRNFSDGEFNERTFNEQSFTDKNFTDTNFNERKEKLSTSSFHKEREGRESNLVSRNSFSGFPRIGGRDGHFQLMPDGRSKRVSEFECDI